MPKVLRSFGLLALTLVVLGSGVAQITIQSSDAGTWLSPGVAITSMIDTSTHTVNIGAPGATSWDLSALVTDYMSTSVGVRPDTTPYAADFPGSTHGQMIGPIYSYYKLSSSELLFSGIGPSFPFPTQSHFTPDQVIFKFPLTLGTTWTTSFTDTTTIVLPGPLPPQVVVSSQVVDLTVDAYGELTLPGGGVHQALRLKSDRTTTSTPGGSVRSITWIILSDDGSTASVVAADTLQADNGAISVSNSSWNDAVLTDVRADGVLPSEFSLGQNYPNPFNPSTTIEFDLPAASDVRLDVVNALGENVATLVNGRRAAGRYAEVFDASGLPSGMYFCRLLTSRGPMVRKMLLMK